MLWPGLFPTSLAVSDTSRTTVVKPTSKVLTTMSTPVWSVTCLSDGKILIAGTDDGQLVFIERPSNRITTLPNAHKDAIRSVVVSPDRTMLATASWDTTVKLWDLQTRKPLATLKGHEAEVRAVAFSPDGKVLATGSGDYTIRLWDVTTRKPLGILGSHGSFVNGVAFEPGHGRVLASASSDNTIKLWDVDRRKCRATLRGHRSDVSSVAFCRGGGPWSGGLGPDGQGVGRRHREADGNLQGAQTERPLGPRGDREPVRLDG